MRRSEELERERYEHNIYMRKRRNESELKKKKFLSDAD